MQTDLTELLIPRDKRGLWRSYLKFVRLGTARFAYEKGREAAKAEKLRLLEKALRRNTDFENNILTVLQKEFIKENLSVSLLTDWIAVWRYTSLLPLPAGERRISDIIGYAASPLARMIMALNDEHPSEYLPFCSLVSAVLFIRMRENKSVLLKGSKWPMSRQRSKLKGWLKNAHVVLEVVRSKRLKFAAALLSEKLKSYEKAFANNKQPETGFIDKTRIFLYAAWQFAAVRRRSVDIKGL